MAWSTTTIAGFVNFQTSLAAALLCVAVAASRLEGSWISTLIIHLISSTILLFIHPLGLLFYAIATIGLLMEADFPRNIAPAQASSFARQLAALVIAVSLATVFKSLLFPAAFGAPGAAPPQPFWGDFANIVDPVHVLTILFSPLLSYNLTADTLTSCPVAALVLYALFKRYVQVHTGLAIVAGGLFALSPLAPDAFGDGSWLPQRFPIMSALLFLAALRPNAEDDELSRTWLLKALPLLVMSRTLWIAWVWLMRQSDIASLVETIRDIAPGSSVITLQQEWRDWRRAPTGRFMIGSPNGVRATGRHLGGLVVIGRRAFVPTLFSVPGQHPLKITARWRNKAVIASSIPYPRQLGATLSGDPYLKDWRANFDYVLLLNADLPSLSSFDPAALADLAPVADHGFARLYKVIAR